MALRGLPAAVMTLVVLVVAVEARRVEPASLGRQYQRAAAQALESEQEDAARLWLEQAVQLNPRRTDAQLALARLLEQSGEVSRADAVFRQLAPADRSGQPAAHLHVARRLMADRKPESFSDPELIGHHLNEALGDPQTAPEAHAMLGLLHAEQGQLTLATTHLRAAAEHEPTLWIPLGRLYLRDGKEQAAVRAFESGRAHFTKRLSKNPGDVAARLDAALCETMLGRLAHAELLLKQGLSIERENSQIKGRLSGLYLTRFDQEWQSGAPRAAESLRLLDAAAELTPGDVQVLNRLSRLAQADPQSRRHVLDRLIQAVAAGQASATVHFVLGVIAAEDGKFDRAREHYGQALSLRPASWPLLNNMAWALAHSEPPQLEQALQLVNTALEIAPGHPELLDTRGTIHALRQDWRACATDLQQALPDVSDRRRVHETLARAWQNLGDSRLASEHRRLAVEAQPPGLPDPEPSVSE